MIQLLILADDFTGALDTGVQFAEKGTRTRVITREDVDFERAAGECQVLVIAAETRHLSGEQAHDTVYRIVKKGAGLGIPHIYKKTDSALRGNIGAELSAALEACGADTLYFLPALPGMNRVTADGIHYIDGVPAAESVFGKDPFSPVRRSTVTELLALQSGVPARSVKPDRIPAEKGIVTIDAQSDADLRRAGRQLKESGRLRLTAGCAGFAAVLQEMLELKKEERPRPELLPGGLFALCGSVNPITRRQMDYAEKHGFVRRYLTAEEKLNPNWPDTPGGKEAAEALRREIRETPRMILDSNDPEDRNAESAAYAEARGMTAEETRQRISGSLGRLAAQILPEIRDRNLLITGGDTLLQCMNQMGVWEMEPAAELFAGVVLSRFTAGGETRYVISKSGGFGEQTLLNDIADTAETQAKTK